jgi:hypothetical protein
VTAQNVRGEIIVLKIVRSHAGRPGPRLHGCTVEEYVYFHHAALARCCAFNLSAVQSLRGSWPHQPAPCRPYAADGC